MNEPILPKKPSSSPAPLTAEAAAACQPQADGFREDFGWIMLAACLGRSWQEAVGSGGFKAYRDGVLRAAGGPADPIEVMLIEQLLWAHHRLGNLHGLAASTASLEAAGLYSGAAARLMAEFRKTALALREYRTPVVPKQLTLVQQQNLAAGDQQIAYLDGKAAVPSGAATNPDTELGGNRREAIAHEPQTVFNPQSQAGGCRETEPIEARPLNAGRARAAAAVGACEPALGALHRSKNGRR